MSNRIPSQKTSAIGLRQVAERAGISVATASAVLSSTRSNTRVSEQTRERVLQTARELHYHPNALARALTGQPTRTIGVLFGLERASVAVANPYIFTLLQGIVACAAESGYNVTLFTEPWHGAARSSGSVRDGRTDGVVVIAPTTDSDIISSLVAFGIPVVSVATPREASLAPSVDVDNAQGARLATEHLLSLGHTRIAHLTGDLVLRSGVERRDAFLNAMATAGVPVPSHFVLPGVYTPQSGRERAAALLAQSDLPTAIFAASDEIAQGVLEAAREKNIPVPNQLSVVGFNDLPQGAQSDLPLTTIRQPLTKIGTEAARLLLQIVKAEPPPSEAHLFAPELVVRASTAPPPVPS